MASIDWGMIGLGALVGIGCRKQLKACGRVAATTAASLAGVAAQAAQQVAETEKSSETATDQKVAEMNRKIDQLLNEWQGEDRQNG